MSQESFFEKKNCSPFIYKKTIEKWGQNIQKNFKHLSFIQKNASWLTSLTILKQWSVICFDSKGMFWIIFWLPQEALLKIEFQQKLHDSATFGYFYFKIT